jgi:ABC-type multidrug transport system permease subunit
MLRVLIAKDLRRAWRNPLPWLINLIVPLAMTALLGLVFGGGSEGGALGRIRFAVVDEDQSVLSDFLRGAANQHEGGKYLEPVFLDREEALRQINENKISAVLIIPTNFMRNYLTAQQPVSLELIKNPAESIHPAVLEELLGAVTTALNAISRNFNSEFPEWQAVFEGKEDYHKVSFLIERVGNKLKRAQRFLNPPLVSYTKEESGTDSMSPSPNLGDTNTATSAVSKAKPSQSKAAKRESANGVYAFLLIGLSAMFLLFLAHNAMTDMHRELRNRTFERYQTMHRELWPFVVSKVLFTLVVLVLCSAIMLGGGGLMFRIAWKQPVALFTLLLGYNCFVAAFFAALVGLVPDERRAVVLNNLAGMALGLIGGCAFPARNLPAFLRDHVTPLMPSNWFVETARTLQLGHADANWIFVSLKFAALTLLFVGLAAALFRRRFAKGWRA